MAKSPKEKPAQVFVVRTIDDFDRLVPPTPESEPEPLKTEDPEAFGRRLARQILRDVSAQIRHSER
jgi:hypothetical protein